MPSDIVDRLNESAKYEPNPLAGLLREASVEIQKLRDYLSSNEGDMRDDCDRINRLRQERESARRELKVTEEILDANNSVITDLTNQITDLKMKLRQLLRLSQTMGEIAAEK